MSISAKGSRRGWLTFALLFLAGTVVASLVPASSSATRPVLPPQATGPVCPAPSPSLRVKPPAQAVSAPSNVRIRARLTGVRQNRCFDIPVRVCLRNADRRERDLRVRRSCFRRGIAGAPISKKAVFMIRVRARAAGRYGLVVQAAPIRPRAMYRSLLAPRVTTRLQVTR